MITHLSLNKLQMALKCPYLAKFTLQDILKNGNNIWGAAENCPFMINAKRMISTSSIASGDANKTPLESKLQHTQANKQANVSTLTTMTAESKKCPFFNNSQSKSYLVETKLDESNDLIDLSRKHVDRHSENHALHNRLHSHENSNKEFDYETFFNKKIDDKKKDNSYRVFKQIVRKADTFPIAEEQETKTETRDITIWCSNDYLGLGRHDYVKNEVIEAVKKYGAGSGGTRNISGSAPLHFKLEDELASLHQKQSALVFTSCYVANDTALFTLAKMLPNCHILSDSGNHASMIQGIRNSGVPKHIFRHNDTKHLEELLKKLPIHTPKIVAFESVHSMDGSICNLEEMCDITHKYGGIAFVDEVHAVGLYGKNGAGIGERDNVLDKMDIISGTLGKAFGNVGGYIAGSSAFIDMIRSYGSGFIFTTSLPPSVITGSIAAITISKSDEGRELRAKHQLNAKLLKEKLINANLPVMNSPSHIVPILVGDVTKAGNICNRLLKDYGIYIQSINYPTVARGTERLRIVPNPLHTPEMIDYLVESVTKVWVEANLPLTANNNQEKTKALPYTCKTCNRELLEKESCEKFEQNCDAIAVF